MDDTKWAIGIDLGGTKIRFAEVTAQGLKLKSLRTDTLAVRGAEKIIDDIIVHCQQLIKESTSKPEGIGIGVAGQVDKQHGSVTYAPNLQWNHVPLKRRIQEKLDLPVYVTNDVRAATWGEWIYGAGIGCHSFVCLFVGTGVGSGVVCEGQMLEGANNAAGEIGHWTIDKNGPLCRCGNIGCVEAYAGGWATAEHVKHELAENPLKCPDLIEKVRGVMDNITAREIFQMAVEGNAYCKAVEKQVIDALICAAVNIANGFNPQKIIFGGGIMQAYPHLIEQIADGVRSRALKATSTGLEFVPAEFSDDAPLIGAAAEVFGRASNKSFSREV